MAQLTALIGVSALLRSLPRHLLPPAAGGAQRHQRHPLPGPHPGRDLPHLPLGPRGPAVRQVQADLHHHRDGPGGQPSGPVPVQPKPPPRHALHQPAQRARRAQRGARHGAEQQERAQRQEQGEREICQKCQEEKRSPASQSVPLQVSVNNTRCHKLNHSRMGANANFKHIQINCRFETSRPPLFSTFYSA